MRRTPLISGSILHRNDPIGLTRSLQASVEVPQLQLSYAPGDVIQGIVKSINIGSLPESVTAVIKLIARIETQVTTESSNSNGSKSTSHYLGQRTLLDFRQHVYEGPVNPGINTWPFSVTIPNQPVPTAFPNAAVLPVGDSLPPTITQPSWVRVTGGRRDYLYVEYRLEANVYQASAPRAVATFPIFVRPRSTAHETDKLALYAALFTESVKTLHLDPEYADKSLSFRQHLSSIFQRSKLPEFKYTIVVEYPSAIQLDHTSPVSFRLRAVVESFRQPAKNTNGSVEKPPTLTLVAADIRLQNQTTTDELEGNSYRVTSRQAGSWRHKTLIDWKEDPNISAGITIPDDVAAPNSAVDIGKNFQLFLLSHAVALAGIQRGVADDPIYPSFNTRHISHTHSLTWKIVVSCAGKNRKISGSAPITVLGPSEQENQSKDMIAGPDGIASAHHEWVEHQVRTPLLAANIAYAARSPIYQARVASDDKGARATKS